MLIALHAQLALISGKHEQSCVKQPFYTQFEKTGIPVVVGLAASVNILSVVLLIPLLGKS